MSALKLNFRRSAVPPELYLENIPSQVFPQRWKNRLPFKDRLPVIDSAPWFLARAQDPGFKDWVLKCLAIYEGQYDLLVEELEAYVQAHSGGPKLALVVG